VDEKQNYWTGRRLNRRGFVRGSFGIAALGGLVMAGCSSNKSNSTANKPSNAPAASGQQPKFKDTVNIGSFIDRSGPTAPVGNDLGNGVKDWADYLNAQGGANGHKLNFVEFDHKYDAALAQQGYKQYVDQDKVVAILSYGTPITDALKNKAADDKIPMMTPGYGLSDSSDGTKYPWLYVGAASYQAQMRALLKYISEDWTAQKKTGNAKLSYVYYDNAAGKDPFPVLDTMAPKMNIDVVNRVAVPTTAVDLTQQFQEAKSKDPDYVIQHLFGATPPLGIKAWKQVGLNKPLIGMVWAFGEPDIETAGTASEGYSGLQFTAMPEENPEALQTLRDYWKKIGRAEPKEAGSVYYIRGVLNADVIFKAAMSGGDKLTGDTMKKGLDDLKDYKVHGLSSGITMTPTDHGGTNKVKIYTVKSGKIALLKDWFEGPAA